MQFVAEMKEKKKTSQCFFSTNTRLGLVVERIETISSRKHDILVPHRRFNENWFREDQEGSNGRSKDHVCL